MLKSLVFKICICSLFRNVFRAISTNHQTNFGKNEERTFCQEEKKMASYLYRTATTAYPCYIPVLGEFSRSWSYKTCRCKGNGRWDNMQIKLREISAGVTVLGGWCGWRYLPGLRMLLLQMCELCLPELRFRKNIVIVNAHYCYVSQLLLFLLF